MFRVQKRKTLIVHVAPYFEEGNPFGGPFSVARDLVIQLKLQNYDAILIAGTRSKIREIDGVFSKLFRSFRIYKNGKLTGLFSPLLVLWIIFNKKNIKIIHIHLAREISTMLVGLVAKLFRIEYVTQTHGMIRKPKNFIEVVFDKIFTRIVLRNSKYVLYLTPDECKRLRDVEKYANYYEFHNSIRIENYKIDFVKKESEVLFISRLHKNKQPLLFLKIALELANKFPNTSFVLIGPDGGELQEIEKKLSLVNQKNVSYEGALNHNQVQNRLSRSTIYVLPTLTDVFPITLLEAMAAGCAIVTTHACEVSNLLTENNFGLVTEPSEDELLKAIESLLRNKSLCKQYARNAHNYAIKNLDIRSNIGTLVSNFYN